MDPCSDGRSYPVKIPSRRQLVNLLVVVLLANTVVIGVLGTGSRRVSAATVSTTLPNVLVGEGGSLAEPIVDKLLTDGAAGSAPLSLSYFNANVDQGRDDFVNGAADFDVTELPLSSAQTTTSTKNGRSFAYVPFAASPIAIGAIVECEADETLKPTTMCPNLQVTVPQLAGLFTQDIGSWLSTQLSTISAGKPITPFAQGAVVSPQLLADPSASTEALIALFDADTTASATWSAFVTSLKSTNDAPTETWPTMGGVHGGDGVLAKTLVPLVPSTSLPQPNPATWGLGDIAPLASDWIGPPENIPTIAVQNKANAFVSPTVAGATAALKDATFDSSTNLVTFQRFDKRHSGIPIMVMSYLVVPTSGLPASKATALASFIRFVLGTKGQADVSALGAAPVTPAMVTAGMTVANEVAASGASYSTSVNGSSAATISFGSTATLAESGLPSGATGTVAFTSDSTALCTVALPATSCTTASTLAAGVYGKIAASYVSASGVPGIAASNTVSLTVSAAPTSTTTTTATTVAGTSGSGGSDGSSSDGGSGELAFTGVGGILPLSGLGAALLTIATVGRRLQRRRVAKS